MYTLDLDECHSHLKYVDGKKGVVEKIFTFFFVMRHNVDIVIHWTIMNRITLTDCYFI